jgi:uroporphyrinogen-III synthase
MSLSLAGLRVLLTRPEGEGMDDWASAFATAGAVPIPYPVIVVVPPASWREVDAALGRLDEYDWLVFTSQTAVAFVLPRLAGARFPTDLRTKLAAVGSKTAKAIERGGGRVSLIPSDQRQEGLVAALSHLPPETRVLLPMASGGRTFLSQALRSRGCRVDVVTAYETQPRMGLPEPPAFDVATFSSPSALRAFLAAPGKVLLARKVVAVIGRTTAREALAHGLVPVVAESPSVDDLIRAIAESRLAQGGR